MQRTLVFFSPLHFSQKLTQTIVTSKRKLLIIYENIKIIYAKDHKIHNETRRRISKFIPYNFLQSFILYHIGYILLYREERFWREICLVSSTIPYMQFSFPKELLAPSTRLSPLHSSQGKRPQRRDRRESIRIAVLGMVEALVSRGKN